MRPDIDWNKEFPLTTICRADLVTAGFTQAQVACLTDQDMTRIASKMEDWYCDSAFWDDLRTAVEYILERTEGEQMELFPEEVRRQLPPLYSQEHEPDPMVICKFFHPLSQWTWYAYEGSPEGTDFIFFGWVYGDFPELGYFSLHELESVSVMGLGIERDLQFTPTRLSEVKQFHAETPPAQPPTITIYVIDDLEEEGEEDEEQK